MKALPFARWMAPSLVIALALAGGAAPAAADATPLVKRVYHVERIDPQDAIMLAHQLCLSAAPEEQCSYSQQGRNWFTYMTTPAVQDRIAALLKERDIATPTLSFRVTLLRAHSTAGPAPVLPEGERRALADLQKLFPYKGYVIIDSGSIRSSTEAQIKIGGEPGYVAQMKIRHNRGSMGPGLEIERFQLLRLPSTGAGRTGDEAPRAIELIMSSFTMDIGETVVVGTSRPDPLDEALIVLLTAGR